MMMRKTIINNMNVEIRTVRFEITKTFNANQKISILTEHGSNN